jgi:hypothetical protein
VSPYSPFRRTITVGTDILVSILSSMLICAAIVYVWPGLSSQLNMAAYRIAAPLYPGLCGGSWFQKQGVFATNGCEAIYVGMLGGFGALFGAAAFKLISRRRRGTPDGHTRCGHCGYILRGLEEPRCSECGEPI